MKPSNAITGRSCNVANLKNDSVSVREVSVQLKDDLSEMKTTKNKRSMRLGSL